MMGEEDDDDIKLRIINYLSSEGKTREQIRVYIQSGAASREGTALPLIDSLVAEGRIIFEGGVYKLPPPDPPVTLSGFGGPAPYLPASSNVRAPFDDFLEKAEKEIDDNVKKVLSWHDDLLDELEGQADDIIPDVPPGHIFPSPEAENVENDDKLDAVLENAYFEEAEIAFDNSQRPSAVPSGAVSRVASGVNPRDIAEQREFAEKVRSALLDSIPEGVLGRTFKLNSALRDLEALKPIEEDEGGPRRSSRISDAQAHAAAKQALETAIQVESERVKALSPKKKAQLPPPRTPAMSRTARTARTARAWGPTATPSGVRKGLASLDSSDQQVRSIYGTDFFRHVYTNVYANGKLKNPPTCWLCGLLIYFKSQLQYEHILRFATAACMGLLYSSGLGLNNMQKIVMQSLGECSHAECNGKGSGDTRKAKGDIKLIDYGAGPGWTTLRPHDLNIRLMLVGDPTVPGSVDKSIYTVCSNSNNDIFRQQFLHYYQTPQLFLDERFPVVRGRVGQLCIMVRDYVDYPLFNAAKADLAAMIAGQTPLQIKGMKGQLLPGIYTKWPLGRVVDQPLMVYKQGMYMNPDSDPSLPIPDHKYTWRRHLGISYGFAKCLENIGLRPGGLPPMNIVFGPNAVGANVIGGSGASSASTRRHRKAQQKKKLRTQKRRRVTVEIVPYQP
jgi:hypothetical protein